MEVKYMNDDFLKTIQAVQSTGQAPINQNQNTKETDSSSRLITESQQPTAKVYRYTRGVKESNAEKNDD